MAYAVSAVNDLFPRHRDFGDLQLRADHERRPLWVCPNGRIFLEKSSPIYQQAYDFLIAISEPICRPEYIHEYTVTAFSLYAAASLGLTTEDIQRGLDRMSKNEIDPRLIKFIHDKTHRCGKVKMLLKHKRYYVESLEAEILQVLLKDEVIASARVDLNPIQTPKATGALASPTARKDELKMTNQDANRMGPSRTFGSFADRAREQYVNLTFTKRTAIEANTNSRAPKLERDPLTGFLVERFEESAPVLFIPGTGTVELNDPKTGSKTVTAAESKATGKGSLRIESADGNVITDDMIKERKLIRADARRAMGIIDDDEEDAEKEEGADAIKKEKDDDTATLGLGEKRSIDQASRLSSPNINSKPKEDEKKPKENSVRPRFVYSFEVDPSRVEEVRQRASVIGYPMLEEYDFRRDKLDDEEELKRNPSAISSQLPIKLKPSAQIRDYQEKALSKMFGNGRARSGIIVLPCGAGKTLVGITAMATIGRSALIVATTAVAVEQWRRQIHLWTQLDEKHVVCFTRNSKAALREGPKVVITTYSMIAYEQKRGPRATEIMKMITQQEWGLILLDEVHVAPADKFKKCVSVTHSRCKLGLTATLVREDDKIEGLTFLIGPKLYEANWLDLQARKFIATVRCIEVWCPMPPAFYHEYLASGHHKQHLLYVTNPNKYRTMEALVRQHEARGDKIMIFSDNVFALRIFSELLGRPAIYGDTPEDIRMQILRNFASSATQNTIFISKVGDNSIDLPDTNVIIQISSHYSSRRQEAQRLGRITRPKSGGTSMSKYDAHFYTLVSTDTKEMIHASRRQRFLVDQGYSYKVLKQSEIEARVLAAGVPPLRYSTTEEQLMLLRQVMDARADLLGDEKEIDEARFDEDSQTLTGPKGRSSNATTTVRSEGVLSSMTGSSSRMYSEVQRKR